MVDISKILCKMKLWKYGARTGAVKTLLRSIFFSFPKFCRWPYIHTYIPTYLPTYIRTYIHTNSSAYRCFLIFTLISKRTCRYWNIGKYTTHSNGIIHIHFNIYTLDIHFRYTCESSSIFIYIYTYILCTYTLFHVSNLI